jgi:formylmethanofuran dehydrogenase subunit C
MSLNLILHTLPEVPLEAALLRPDTITGMNESAIAGIKVMHGNQPACVGDFFKVTGKANGEMHLEGDLARIKHLGANMTSGQMIIHGNAGVHLGTGMSGGEIIVDGDAADWVGPEMSGGRIIVKGSAGHLVGSAYRGSTKGMLGGEIIIHGNVKNETGHAMRNGLIIVGGNSGDFTGVNMLAGTIVVLGEMGIRSGAGMKRGTIVSMHQAEMLPTFSYSCLYHPTYLGMLLQHVAKTGLKISNQHLQGQYQRWCGDSVEFNRGEILIYQE